MKPLVLGESVLYNAYIGWPPKYDPTPGMVTRINADGTYEVAFIGYTRGDDTRRWYNDARAWYGFRDGYLPEGHFARVGEVGPLCKQITREGE